MIKLETMSWCGFYSYPKETQSFTFTPGFHLIYGANGSGKSSFLNLITLALFDKAPGTAQKKEAVNETTGFGKITLGLSINNVPHNINYERSSKNFRWELFRNGEKVIDGATTGEHIEKLMGFGYDQFVNAFYLAQNAHFAFKMFYGDPSDRLEILSSIFKSGEFLQASAMARDESTRLAAEESMLKEAYTSANHTVDGYANDIERCKANVLAKAVYSDDGAVKIIIDELKEKIVMLNQRLRGCQATQELSDISRAISNAEIQITNLTNDNVNLQTKLNSYNEYLKRLPEYQMLGNDINLQKIAIATEQQNLAMLTEKIGRLKAAADIQKTKLAKIKKDEGVCDTCGSAVGAAQLKDYADKTKKDIDQTEAELGQRLAERDNANATLTSLNERLRMMGSKTSSFEQEFGMWFNHPGLDTSLVTRNNEQIAILKNSLTTYRQEYEETSSVVKRATALRNEIINAQAELSRHEKILAEQQLNLANYNNAVKERDSAVARHAEALHVYAQAYEKHAAASRQHSRVSFWSTGFKELAVLRLCGFVESINERMEQLLAEFGMNCWIDVLEAKKSAKNTMSLDSFKRKANIFVSAPGRKNTPIEAYSGGEKQLLALAMVLSLGQIVGDLNYLALDEVFGSLDPDNRPKVLDMLNRERASGSLKGKCVMMISHDPEIQSGLDFDSIIKVKTVNGFSKLNTEV